MNNREKEVLEYTLEQEKSVIAELKSIYSQALDDIGEKINALMADELTQSKIYQIEYQKALKGQASAILDNLNSQQYDSISEYLRGCYEDGFIGALYNLQGSGVPLIIPINQDQVVSALLLDSKISEGLYTKLGNNVSELKKSISREISRGISTSMSYHDIARNLRSKGNMTINQSMNIVQTEGHRIQNRSALDAGEKAKAKGADVVKVWDSTLDSKTRPHHRALDGQVRELDEDFEVDGLTADSPGHFGIPSEDCRCRCVVLIKPRWDVDGSFTKRNNETGELLEFADVKSYEEFKNKYWKTVDKSGGSGIIKERKTIDDFEKEIAQLEKEQIELSGWGTYDELVKDFGSVDDYFDNEPDASLFKAIQQKIQTLKVEKKKAIIDDMVNNVKPKNQMTISMALKANPNYNTDRSYKVNCQRCVQTYELRRRGYDVIAKPKMSKGDSIVWGSECFTPVGQDPYSSYTMRQTAHMVKKEVESAPDGARYSIYVNWKNSGSAHVFIAEKENGIVRYFDPQTDNPDVEYYFSMGRSNGFGFFRMDDKPIIPDKQIINQTVEVK